MVGSEIIMVKEPDYGNCAAGKVHYSRNVVCGTVCYIFIIIL